MIYYTIYVKNLHNNTGYIDVALADDQLLKDFLQYLDVNIKPVRTYVVTESPKTGQGREVASTGTFAVNFSDITAITAVKAELKHVEPLAPA